MHTIGYARVSIDDQTTALQLDALRTAGCSNVYQDMSILGVAKDRPALTKAINALQPGDVFVVCRLDRLGRSLADLIRLVAEIEHRGAGFRSLVDALDTTTANGRLVFHITGAMAQFERSLTQERTKAGLAAARERGVRLGRKPMLNTLQLDHARSLVASGQRIEEVAHTLGVSYWTLYRAFKNSGADTKN